MENGVTFELSQDFEQKVFNFMVEMLKNYDDKTEAASYVISQIGAALEKITNETYNPQNLTIEDYLKDLGQN